MNGTLKDVSTSSAKTLVWTALGFCCLATSALVFSQATAAEIVAQPVQFILAGVGVFTIAFVVYGSCGLAVKQDLSIAVPLTILVAFLGTGLWDLSLS